MSSSNNNWYQLGIVGAIATVSFFLMNYRVKNTPKTAFASPPAISEEEVKEKILARKFLDQKRWNCISRPQYKHACSVASLTAIFNYLYTTKGQGSMAPITQDDVLKVIGHTSTTRFGPIAGNKAMIKWFYDLCKYYKVKGKANIIWKLHGTGKTPDVTPEIALQKIRASLVDPHSSLVYHSHNHYMVPIGYEISNEDPADAYNPFIKEGSEAFVLVGDSSKTSRSIHCAKFSDIVTDLSLEQPNFFNIRHPELGIQVQTKGVVGGTVKCFIEFRSDQEGNFEEHIHKGEKRGREENVIEDNAFTVDEETDPLALKRTKRDDDEPTQQVFTLPAAAEEGNSPQ